MTDAKPVDVGALVAALGHQRQCDEDGTDCIVSRQAVDEARELILALQAEVARLTQERDRNNVETSRLLMESANARAKLLADVERLTQENARLTEQLRVATATITEEQAISVQHQQRADRLTQELFVSREAGLQLGRMFSEEKADRKIIEAERDRLTQENARLAGEEALLKDRIAAREFDDRQELPR